MSNWVLGKDVVVKVEDYIKPFLDMKDFSGAILVARDGELLLSKGYGMANYELDVPNTPQTKFLIGSLSKQFTATAIMQLEEQGQLSVNDPLTNFVSDYPKGDKITLHHLLTHTSGITRNVTNSHDMLKLPRTLSEIIGLFRDKPLDFEPGERYSYSNAGYILLAYILERVSGQSFGEFLGKYIFAPLDMENTGHYHNETILKNRASGYDPAVDGGIKNAAYEDISNGTGAGSIYSTIEDLYKWDRSLYTEKVLKKESLEKMFTPYLNEYGYGISVYHRFDRKVVGHDGSGHGFSTFMEGFVDDDSCIIYLSNIRTGAKDIIRRDLAAILLGEEYEIPIVRETLKEGIATRICEDYVGIYGVSTTLLLEVKEEEGHLFLKGTGGVFHPLDPESETVFFYRHMYAQITFVGNKKGEVSHLIWRDIGHRQDWICKKIT